MGEDVIVESYKGLRYCNLGFAILVFFSVHQSVCFVFEDFLVDSPSMKSSSAVFQPVQEKSTGSQGNNAYF
jgi:hypothetical protein